MHELGSFRTFVDGMNHVLKAADSSNAAQQDTYTNPSLPIVPELVAALVETAAAR